MGSWADCDTVVVDPSFGEHLSQMHVGVSGATGGTHSQQLTLTRLRALNRWDEDPEAPEEREEPLGDGAAGGAPQDARKQLQRMQLHDYGIERRVEDLQHRVLQRTLNRLDMIEHKTARASAQTA